MVLRKINKIYPITTCQKVKIVYSFNNDISECISKDEFRDT